MGLYLNPFNQTTEPNDNNIRQWLDSTYSKFQPIEQARWNQSHIDTLFYAGCQTFVNSLFNFSPNRFQQYYFNLVQQPVNMITGYQRQHRKATAYTAADGADPETVDQYTRLMMNIDNRNGLHEIFSKSCEYSAIAGMNLMQPYLDFTADDPAQGDLKIKVWEYNSFMIDPYFRNPDLSDCNMIWCQEYISKEEARERFPNKESQIEMLKGGSQRYGNFYFLPENNNMNRTDLLILSYVWYKSTRMKERLYSRKRNQFFDFVGTQENMDEMLYNIPDLEIAKVKTPTWKLATVLNDKLMYHGLNPLGIDSAPMVVNFWNYEPHISYYDLRNRSLIRPMRDPQFLFNYKVITNNDIAAATLNAGWKRKESAVVNEENLHKTGQGFDVIINDNNEMTDCEKILPSAVPQSDIELANQMSELIYNTSGINLENWSGQNDKQISSLTAMIKQAANLMVFQKYFDQWDYSLKLLGSLKLQIVLNNWNAQKIGMIIGEEPTPFFYSRVFSKYLTTVEEALLTPTQKTYQAQQMMEINQAFGREVIPPSMIIKDMDIQGKAEIMQMLQQQEQSMQQQQQEQSQLQMSILDAQLKELYSKAAANIATARERHGRSEANIGLFEERLSEITRNRALATKDKMEALQKLIETIAKFGELETMLKMGTIDTIEEESEVEEDIEKMDVKKTSLANSFLNNIMKDTDKLGQMAEMR